MVEIETKVQRYERYIDSGVEWLGEILKEWKTSKMKFELTIFGRIGFRGYTTDDIVDEGVSSKSPIEIIIIFKTRNEFSFRLFFT